MKKETPETRLRRLSERTGGELRISRGGVPHLVLDMGDMKASVCYFGKSRSFRVFYPYGVYGAQEKTTLGSAQDVVNYVASLKEVVAQFTT